MRRVNLERAAAAIPANAYVEIVQSDQNSDLPAARQYAPLSLVGQSSAFAAPPVGITEGVGTVVKSAVEKIGDFKRTTLFIDITGLLASATDLDIVGALGSDIVVNGAFAADTDWTKPANWTIAAGVATSDGTQVGDADLVNVGPVAVAGAVYQFTFTVSGWTAGNVTPVIGSQEGTDRGADGTYVEYIIAANTAAPILRADLDFAGNVDNVTVKRVQPSYLFQIDPVLHGTIFKGSVECVETPSGAVDDLDFYAAVEATGYYDLLVTDLTDSVLLTKGGSWTASATPVALSGLPAANQYLYLVAGAGAGGGTFVGGQFVIELWGY